MAQYAQYATQSNGKPIINPNQNKTLPSTLFRFMIGRRPTKIKGTCDIYNRNKLDTLKDRMIVLLTCMRNRYILIFLVTMAITSSWTIAESKNVKTVAESLETRCDERDAW